MGWPCVLLAFIVGVAGEFVSALFSPKDSAGSPLIPGVVVAIIFGFCIFNSPLGGDRLLALQDKPNCLKWSEGLSFIDKVLLRLAVILLGFQVSISDLQEHPQELLACLILIPFCQAVAFFAAQGLCKVLRLSNDAADLLSIGTMVCGASAINALGTSKRKDMSQEKQKELSEQSGLAISAVFLSSCVSILAFKPLGYVMGISDETGGLWAGLAVGDLSSTIAVGSQFGGMGTTLASMAKSVRILTLVPHLLLFSFVPHKSGKEAPPALPADTKALLKQIWDNSPFFMVFFVLLFAVRVVLESTVGNVHDMVYRIQIGADYVITGIMVTVCAAIGMRMRAKTMLKSWKFVIAGLGASLSLSMSSLVMLQTFTALEARNDALAAFAGAAGVGAAFAGGFAVVYFFVRRYTLPNQETEQKGKASDDIESQSTDSPQQGSSSDAQTKAHSQQNSEPLPVLLSNARQAAAPEGSKDIASGN